MKAQQQGMVLLISLLLLLMLTVIAITAASQSNLQVRISSNSQQQNIAFQKAESGLAKWASNYFCKEKSACPERPLIFMTPAEFDALAPTGDMASEHYEAKYVPTGANEPGMELVPGFSISSGTQALPVIFSVSSQGCVDDDSPICTRHRAGMLEYIPPDKL